MLFLWFAIRHVQHELQRVVTPKRSQKKQENQGKPKKEICTHEVFTLFWAYFRLNIDLQQYSTAIKKQEIRSWLDFLLHNGCVLHHLQCSDYDWGACTHTSSNEALPHLGALCLTQKNGFKNKLTLNPPMSEQSHGLDYSRPVTKNTMVVTSIRCNDGWCRIVPQWGKAPPQPEVFSPEGATYPY